MKWLFTRGTLVAHAVLSETAGTTVCGRRDLKFEPPVPNIVLEDKYKCVTCRKTLAKQAGEK